MISLIHYLTMLCAISELLVNSFLAAKVFFRKGLRGRDSVLFIFFLALVGVLSGLSCFPHMLLLFTFNNENCNALKLSLFSVFRVLTTRLQFSMIGCFALDRFISLAAPAFYQSFPRKHPAYLGALVSLLFGVFEVFAFLFRQQDFKTAVRTCALNEVGGPLYERLNPFFNLVQYAFLFLGTVTIFIETVSNRGSDPRRLPAANFAIRWIFVFATLLLLLSLVTPLLLRFQVKLSTAVPDIFVWGDFCLHVNGVLLLPTINYARSNLRRVTGIVRQIKVAASGDTVTVNTVNIVGSENQ